MCRLASSDSDALGIVEDLQLGSSPTTASAPPVRETPTKLPWRSESAARSRPGALPYHMPSTPSCLAPGRWPRQLAAPGRGGAELLVEAGHVADEVLVEQLAVARQLLVEPAQRRALVARDHRAGGQAAAAVGAVLVEHQAHERLHAGEEDAALLEHVLVVEADLAPRASRGRRSPRPRAARPDPAAGSGAPRRRTSVVSLAIGELNLPLVVPGSEDPMPVVVCLIPGIRSRVDDHCHQPPARGPPHAPATRTTSRS